MFNKDFYPTPYNLISKMWVKLDDKKVRIVLEPSAGKGDIANYLTSGYRKVKVLCIEKEPKLQAILREEGHKVIDSDFLAYNGYDQFDAIMMNPPFSEGDRHLLKAMDVLYSGEIVCILNAETIRNPYTETRKELVRRLKEENATIEFSSGEFAEAERKTNVDVAIIHIRRYKDIEREILKDMEPEKEHEESELEGEKEIVTRDNMASLVARYGKTVQKGMETIRGYYENYNWLRPFMSLSFASGKEDGSSDMCTMQGNINKDVNGFLNTVRKRYWEKVLDIGEISSRLTSHKRNQFLAEIRQFGAMEFNLANIKQFALNLVNTYHETMEYCCEKVFDDMTHGYSTEKEGNKYLYNSWKSNSAFAVNKKVVLPFFRADSFWCGWSNKWKVDWQVKNKLDDIDKCMNFFDDRTEYVSITDALKKEFEENQNNRNIETTYFVATVFKKGTIHLTFKDDEIRRRFNIKVGQKKGWLPPNYGNKAYEEMDQEEKKTVKEFEGEKNYMEKIHKVGFKTQKIKLLGV